MKNKEHRPTMQTRQPKRYRVQARYLWSRYESEKKGFPPGFDPAYEDRIKALADRLGV